jgi:hypothetical protein
MDAWVLVALLLQLKEGLLVMGADQVDTDQLNAALVELSNVITNPSSGIL